MNNNDINNEENSNDSLFGRFENAFTGAVSGTSSDLDLDEEYIDEEELEEEDDDSSYDWDRERESSDDNANESNEVSDEGSTDSSEEVSSDASEEVSSDTNEEIVDDSGETTDVVDADDSSHLSREDGTDERANHADDGLSKNNNPNDNVPDDKLNRPGNENGPDQNKFKNDQAGPSKGSDNPYGNPSDPNRLHHNNLPNNGNPAGNAAGNVSEKAGEELAKKGTQEVGKKGVQEVGKKGAEEVTKKGVEAGAKVGTDAALKTAGTTAAGTTAGTPVGWIVVICVVALVVYIVLMVIIFFIVIIVYYHGLSNKEDDSIASMYGNVCPYVTVTDNDHAGTYPFEEYIAGVVQGEVGFFGNGTVDQVFAVAARTYFYTHHQNCTIAGNATKQAFTPTSNQVIINAVSSTAGQVITRGGSMISTEYDALAVAQDNGDSVVLKQRGQVIPKSWLTQHNIGASTLDYYAKHNHGRGMSQWGALYLAEGSGYDYKSILKYYYGDDITIATLSQTYGPTQADGILAEALETYLPRNGSSIDALNSKIYTNVRNAGVGTREGVVAAATTLVETMDSYGVKLPYSNGGGHGHYLDNYGYYNFNSSYGVNPAWGKPGSYPGFGSVTRVYTYFGLDCSGFVSWAIHNGGFAFRASSTGESYGPSCNSTSASCKSKPGDLLLIPGKHVMLIIGESGDTYTVAEAMGGDYGILITTHKKASKYEVVNMDNWYANNKRVDSYPY